MNNEALYQIQTRTKHRQRDDRLKKDTRNVSRPFSLSLSPLRERMRERAKEVNDACCLLCLLESEGMQH